MAIRVTAAVVLAMLLAGVPVAQQARPQDVALQAAIRTQTVDGDLVGAIKQYQAIVEKYSNDRNTVATAWLRMADCHQKLGDAEAKKIYERLVSDFAEQKEIVAIARTRLGVDLAAHAAGDRAVWTGPKVDPFGQVSPDGRYITYVDWGGDQNLIVRDLKTGTDRPLSVTGPSVGFSQFAEYSTISRDGRQVAYTWLNGSGRYDLRIVPLIGNSPAQPRILFPGIDGVGLAPRDWSPDGALIAVSVQRQDLTGQIGLVSVSDGSLRVLKSVDWRGANTIVFSPDGRFMAYDLAAAESVTERHVYVMAIDGSVETVAVAHPSRNVVMAWSPDGRHLLFGSDRAGGNGLWAQPIANGKPQGPAVLLRPEIGSSVSLGLTASGTLFVYKARSANYVQVASLDTAGAGLVPLTGGQQRFVGAGGDPSWSRDGKYLAYRSCGTPPRAICTIEIMSSDTGQTRQLPPKLSYVGTPRWSMDGRAFLTDGTDLKGRRALYRVDAETGEVSFIHERPGAIVQWSRDERKIYYRLGGTVVERELATGAERVLFRERAKGNSISIKVSPDGRYIASVEVAGNTRTLYLIPLTGEPVQELWRPGPGESADAFRLEWTPDSQALYLTKSRPFSKELWWLPLAAPADARRIELPLELVTAGGGFAIHPDGRRIAFTAAAGNRGAEVWALENVLPDRSARSK